MENSCEYVDTETLVECPGDQNNLSGGPGICLFVFFRALIGEALCKDKLRKMFILWCHQCLAQDPPTQEGSESAVASQVVLKWTVVFRKSLFLSPSDTCFEISQCSRPIGWKLSRTRSMGQEQQKQPLNLKPQMSVCLLPSDIPNPATPTFLSPSGCESFGQLCR